MEQARPVAEHDGGIEDRVRLATVAISARSTRRGESLIGTGFFVAPDIVVTCAHVLAEDAASLPAQVEATVVTARLDLTLNTSTERFFRSEAGLDLAILQVAPTAEPCAYDYVLMSPIVEVGDDMWVHGHPDGRFRAGQPATFSYQGASRRSVTDSLELRRLHGTPVGGGFSGSPVINRRTGAVCGMLVTANQFGSAHLLPIDAILELCVEAKRLHQTVRLSHRAWLCSLSDEQLQAGGWAFPGRRLRAYLSAASVAAERHPYEQVLQAAAIEGGSQAPLAGIPDRLPPLSEVYVYQLASEQSSSQRLEDPHDSEPISADTIFDRSDDVFLIGEAGSGKSSLLRAAVVGSVRRWDRDDWDKGVPVRVSAADLLTPCPIPEAIARGVNAELSTAGATQSWPPEFFLTPPTPGVHWLILVDGLDEVVEIAERQEIIGKIANFGNSALASTFRFVVATRPLPDVELRPSLGRSTSAFQLRPFSDSQLRDFAERWFDHLDLPEPRHTADTFVQLVAEAGVDDLFRMPLLAMMLCQLYAADRHRAFPATSVDLYNEFVKLLRERFYKHGGGIRTQVKKSVQPYGKRAQEAGEELLDRVDELIGRLAWNRRQRVLEPAVESAARWTSSLRSGQIPADAWKRLLREIFRRSGVLVERDRDFDFLHKTIAEFVAANFVAADHTLSEEAFQHVFPSRPADWEVARSAWRHPYSRFLIFAWRERPDLVPALRRVAVEGGLDGCNFIAALAAEGVALTPEIINEALTRLRGIAIEGDGGERTRSAIEGAVRLSVSIGWELLNGLIRDSTAQAYYRRWALEALGHLSERRAGIPGSHHRRIEVLVDHTWAVRAIARHGGTEGAQLLEYLASDRTWETAYWQLSGEARALVESLHLKEPRDRQLQQQAELPSWLLPAPTGRRVRARLARFNAPWQSTQVSEVLEPLIATHRASHPKADGRALQRAFDVAARWHSGQYRKSGDPYITHPLAVANILASLGMDTATLVAALLHDTIEDTDYGLEQMRVDFGSEVAMLVDDVTKLDQVKLGDAAETETLLEMVKDPRALVIKLADRLHNMRTLTFLPRASQDQKAKETLEILAPLAHRLGMNTIKWELEDLAFGTLFPNRFEEINRLISEHQPQREAVLRKVTQQIQLDLRSAKIKAETTGRPKHLYSIYQKMINKSRDFNEIYDLVGVRILVDRVRDCYAALGVVHANWQPMPGRFKDYIATPKSNMYQSLHTTVIGPTGKPVEIQIRTFAMHRTAEFGITARPTGRDEPPAA